MAGRHRTSRQLALNPSGETMERHKAAIFFHSRLNCVETDNGTPLFMGQH